LAAELEACLASKCEAECGLTCGGIASIAPPEAAADCSACLNATDNAGRCTDLEEKASDAKFQSYILCRQNCRTGDCIGACSVPNGYFSPMIPLGCESKCDWGDNWACLDHFEWPPNIYDAREVKLKPLTDYLTGQAMANVPVLMCNALDAQCDPYIASGRTDDAGSLTLWDTTPHVANHGLGLNGYLSVNPGGALSGGSAPYPTHIYWGFPLVENHGLIAENIFVLSFNDWNHLPLQIDPTKGTISVTALDCFGNQAPRVAFALCGSIQKPRYVTNLSPLEVSNEPGPDVKVAIFLNVPSGQVDVAAFPQNLSGPPSGRVTVYVTPGTLTEVIVQPTPAAACPDARSSRAPQVR
jgi:hypothetical protein